MSNGKFRKFLDTQSGKGALMISEDRVTWEGKDEMSSLFQPPDFPEPTFGEDTQSNMMSNDRFRKFLKVSKTKVFGKEREKNASSEPSDFLESIYLGKEHQNTVVMERSVAAMFQHRLRELERENRHLMGSVKILKITTCGAVVAFVFVLWILFSLIY